jgi:hypothetical protein
MQTRNRTPLTGALLVLLGAACLRGDSPAGRPDKVRNLVGTIGKGNAIEMRLTETPILRAEGGQTFRVGTRYSGYYSSKKVGTRIRLSGIYNAQGMGGAVEDPTIEIEEFVDGKKTGVFIGHFSESGRYSGTWETWEPARKIPFRLSPKR